MRSTAFVLGLVVIVGSTFADGGTQNPAAASAQATPAAKTSSAGSADEKPSSAMRIVVHPSGTPSTGDARSSNGSGDARVDVGGMRISMPTWSVQPKSEPGVNASSTSASTASPVRTDGAIVMPSNTMGPGEAMWRVRERQDAERRLAQAKADQAEAFAARLERERYESDRSRGYGWRGYGFGYVHSGGFIDDGWPRGPVTTTVTRFNDLHSLAQRNFAEAARPRGLFEAQEARDRALQQFGRDAQPRIGQAQRDREEAFLRANRDNNQTGPTTTEVVPPK
ncbi:MAG: hypothetical protein K2W85_08515 [Phycisphaerales bacterium]|nr:hypothetical protein [Phycisphaerales bacterium]